MHDVLANKIQYKLRFTFILHQHFDGLDITINRVLTEPRRRRFYSPVT